MTIKYNAKNKKNDTWHAILDRKREEERERDRQTDRQKETERERMGFGRRMMKDLRAKIIEIRKGNRERGKRGGGGGGNPRKDKE